jgi:hypothetical protein
VAEPQPPRAAPFGVAEVSHRGKVELGRGAAVQQVEQRRDGGGGESHQRQWVKEAHARRRSAMPNGKSVVTWW